MTSPLEGYVRAERVAGVPGGPADNGFLDRLTGINADPQAKQSDTVTIDTGTLGEDYGVDIDGINIFITAADAVVANIAAQLAAAIQAEPLVNGRLDVSVAGAVVTLVARVAGTGYTIAENQNAAKMTLASVTANDTADPLPFGRLVINAGLSSGSNKPIKALNSTDVTSAADLTAKCFGVTCRDLLQEAAQGSLDAEYAGNEAVSCLRRGRIVVEIEDTLASAGDPVYARVTASGSLDKIGGFARAAGTGLVQFTEGRWIRSLGNGLAVLEVNI